MGLAGDIASALARRSTRRAAAATLLALGFASLVVGIVNAYVRVQVYETRPFADNAVVAFRDDSVKQLIAQKVTAQVLPELPSALRDAEPLIETVLYEVMRTQRFENVFREAAIEANLVFFDKERGEPLLDLSDAGPIVEAVALRFDPSLAEALPRAIEGLLLEVSTRPVVNRAIRIAENARVTTFLWPALAVACFAVGIAVSPTRRRTAIAAGVLVAAAGALLWIAAEATRAFVLSDRGTQTASDAARATVDAFVAEAPLWGLVVALAGAVLAGAGLAAGSPAGLGERLGRAWRAVSRRPERAWVVLARALVVGALGVLAVFEREFTLALLTIALGFLLLVVAVTELMRLAGRVGGRFASVAPWLAALAAVIGLVAAGIVVLV